MKMFEIKSKQRLTENIFEFKVYAPNVAKNALAGEFLITIDNEKGERIPLTICDVDKDNGLVTIVFQVVGDSTQDYSKMQEGDCFRDVVGPLGNASELISECDSWKDKNILWIAGGLGTAPVYPQAKWAKQNNIKHDVIIGTKSHQTLIYEDKMRGVCDNLYICTDDGSYGFSGMVTDCLKDLVTNKGKHYDLVVAIGPLIMMKFVSRLTKELGIKTIVSLNALMVDGTGMCGACRVEVDGKMRFSCVEGPEFDGHKVNFDMAMQRQNMYPKHKIATKTEQHQCNLYQTVEQSLNLSSQQRVPVREQAPEIRNHNFEEVSFGYNDQEALVESSRCLNCKKPLCVSACPVNINIPSFIAQIRQQNNFNAFNIIRQSSSLPAICGRVCPQERQCEGSCIMGKKSQPIAIGKLERYVADWALEHNIKENIHIEANGYRVAIVGSGPSALACASELAKMGYKVSIFEALHRSGGVLSYGIPEFRLPKKKIVEKEIEDIKALGVEINNDVLIGKSLTIQDLFDREYSAVYIASGAGLPKLMDIEGINLNGVLSANEFLTRVNLMKAYKEDYMTPVFVGKKTIVVGGGNVAMDAARSAKRLGSEVVVVYRRDEPQMPARKEEIHHAKEEQIEFQTLTNPVRIIGGDKNDVVAIECVKMQLTDEDASGRRKPVEIDGSEFKIDCDCVIMALGTEANRLIANTTQGLQTNSRGNIIADEQLSTTKQGVFAGGDVVSGSATVILAMGAGKKAAHSIDEYIKSKK